MTSQNDNNSEVKMRSKEIFAAVKAQPSLLADVTAVDPTQYTFTVDGTYIMGVHDVQYAKAYALINGQTMRMVSIDDVLIRSNIILPGIIGYMSFEGIACVVYTQTLTSSISVADTGDGMETDSTSAATSASAESSNETEASAETESNSSSDSSEAKE